MTTLSTPELILKQIAQIQRMERGKLCRLGPGPGGPYFNHQTWEKGRNVVRYIRREAVAALQTALDGYQTYVKLTEAYADLIIAQTRRELQRGDTASVRRRKSQTPQSGKKSQK